MLVGNINLGTSIMTCARTKIRFTLKNLPLAHNSTEVCVPHLSVYAPVDLQEAHLTRTSGENVCKSPESTPAAPSSRTGSAPKNAHSHHYYLRPH